MESETQLTLSRLHIHPESNANVDWSEAIQRVRNGLLSELKFSEERPYDKSDFIAHLNQSYDSLTFALQIVTLEENVENSVLKKDKDVLKNFTVSALLLCGENVQSKEWNESRHIEISYKILKRLKTIFKCDKTVGIFLYQFHNECEGITSDGEILLWAINDLSPKLAKTRWRNFPAAQFCFSWILHQVTFPNLGPRLPQFLPFTLCFIDDWETKNKLMGLTCLDHIVEEANQTELKWYGRSDLIKDALKKLLFCHEENVINIVIPCWLRLLAKVEPCSDHANVNGCDLLTKELLYKLDMETKLDIKRAYFRQLKPLIEALDVGCIRWMSSMLRVISTCLEYPDSDETEDYRVDGLQALEVLLKHGVPRIRLHAKSVFEMLLRLLYETSKNLNNDPKESLRKLHDMCSKCLIFSAKTAPEEFKILCDGMDKVEVNKYFDSVIKSIFNNILTEEKKNTSTIDDGSFTLCMQKP